VHWVRCLVDFWVLLNVTYTSTREPIVPPGLYFVSAVVLPVYMYYSVYANAALLSEYTHAPICSDYNIQQ